MELTNYLAVLRDRWIPALVTAVVVLGAIVAYTLLQTPTYQATNRLFVQTQMGQTAADLSSGAAFAQQQIASYADLATTPIVLQPVIDELGLDTSTGELAESVSTSVPPETLILEVSATAESPRQAQQIADATAESLRQRVGELESDGTRSTVELTVISPATAPTSPASPSLPRNIGIGLILALLAGVAMALLRDLMDNRVRRPADVEKAFDRPVVARIPVSRDTKRMPLISVQKSQSPQAEAFRDLRTNLQFMGLPKHERSVVITSSTPGEGKTSSAVNLAHVIAQAGERALLIDADLRRPSVHKYLHLESSAGLTTVLIGEAEIGDVVQPVETNGLDVLASGPIPPNPSELLGSQQMRDLLLRAMREYDFVIVDAPPLLAVTDAVVLSRLVTGTLVVARSEFVKKQQLAQAVEKLETVDTRILGFILNRVPTGRRGPYSYTYSYASQTPPSDPQVIAKAPGIVAPASSPRAAAPSGSRRAGNPGRHRRDSQGVSARSWPGRQTVGDETAR